MVTLGGSSRRGYVFVLGVLLVLGTVLTSLAAFASPPADESWYIELRGSGMPSALSDLEVLGSVPVVTGLALLALLGWRCRALVAASALSVAGSLLVAALLRLAVSRPRPFDSSLTDERSFPSLTVVVLSLVAVLVPVCLHVLTRGRAVPVAAAVVLWLIVLVVGWQEVYAAVHWPLDVVGGAVIGAGVACTALAVVAHPSALHRRCGGCSWQHAASVTERTGRRLGGRAHPLYRAALVWSLALAVGFGYLALTYGIPRLPESGVMGTGLEAPINIALVVLIVVGVLVAGRWHTTGAVTVAVAATLLGYISSVHYAAWVAALIALAGFVPALLLWVQWHRVASLRSALVVAASTSVVLAVLIYFAASNYSSYWGPTHPTSATPPPPSDVVDWMISGAVTETSVNVRARTERDVARVRLVVARDTDLSGATYSPAERSAASSQHTVSLTVAGLQPGEDYYYALELDGEIYPDRVGHFTTFPRGPASFRFAMASCARTGSNGMVYDAIRRTRPLFFLNYGDWFYGDIERNSTDLFRRQYDANLTSPAQAALYASTSFAYVWDDHDSTGNDADRTSVSWPAAMAVYRQDIPHYPLRGADAPIFQAFTVGDVRFVLTDIRSARDPKADPPTMLGAEQRGWLRRELSQADRYGLVVWANGGPWVGKAEPGNDTWAGFAEERRMIAEAIAEYDVDNLLMVSGDAHMLAYDDGTHTDYSTSQDASFPLFHAAALDRKGSIKGGPYSGPVLPGGGHFGVVDVEDDGRTVVVTMTARNYKGEVLFTRTFRAVREE